MERIQVLIDKLLQQKQQNESVDKMLVTVQLLQKELSSLQSTPKILGTSKVAVVMPVSHVVVNEVEAPAPLPKQEEPVVAKQPVVEVKQPEPAPVVEAPKQSPKPVEYQIPKPVAAPPPAPGPVYEHHAPYYNGQPDVVVEAPTLVQQQIHKEVHELIMDHHESLNDKLKQDRTEVVHKLKEVPVKDLRKAIGINDKFAYINDLFRGDEAMYERSIKTINGFHILQEAEYWINRELKVKLGWDDTKEIVQHFYQLVRRRFS
jgi:hypothetical protein